MICKMIKTKAYYQIKQMQISQITNQHLTTLKPKIKTIME